MYYKINYILIFVLIIGKIIAYILTIKTLRIGEVHEVNPIALWIMDHNLMWLGIILYSIFHIWLAYVNYIYENYNIIQLFLFLVLLITSILHTIDMINDVIVYIQIIQIKT